MAKTTNAAASAGHGHGATEAIMPTRMDAKPSHSMNLPGRTASSANSAAARPNQYQEMSVPIHIHDPTVVRAECQTEPLR